jgi:hypothetical protein
MNGMIFEVRWANLFRAPVLWIVLLITLLSGCVSLGSVPTEKLPPPFNEEVLERLVGSTEEEVREELGMA